MATTSSVVTADDLLLRDREFQPHLAALGLTSPEEYGAWCARNGFSQRLDKHWRDRCRERYFAAEQSVKQRLARAKEQQRKPGEILNRILAAELANDEILPPHWRLVQRTLAGIADVSLQQAFGELLQHVQRDSSALLSAQPVLARLTGGRDNSFVGGALGRLRRGLDRRPPPSGNTFVEGLLALACQRRQWIRPMTAWRPASHSPHRQFASLAAHLLAKYPLPAFLDSVWFQGTSAEAMEQQSWYVALAGGQSPRDLATPIPLRGQMARHFLAAPKDFFCHEAIRYAQVIGLGGDLRLVQAILGSRLGTNFDHNDFWVAAIRWLIRHPLANLGGVSPLLDYIANLRFGSREAGDGLAIEPAPATAAEFTLKGRTPETLLRQMRARHVELRKKPDKPTPVNQNWGGCGIEPFDACEGTLAAGDLRPWTIVELLSRQDLFEEGKVMRHCVVSYASSCLSGRASIWSLGLEKDSGQRRKVVTIEVANVTRTICQVRGKANRLPAAKEIEILRRWAAQEELVLSRHIDP